MIITAHEREQIKTLLPVQSDLKTIELVVGILDKIKLDEKKEIDIQFNEQEFDFLKEMIKYLDHEKRIFISSFSLIQKILRG